jgi:hypothetical protein
LRNPFLYVPFMRQELIDLFFSYNVSQDRHTVEAVVPTFSLALSGSLVAEVT